MANRLSPKNPGTEDDGHRPGDEDGEGEQVDAVDPEHGRHARRQEFVDRHRGQDQRNADGVVDVTVVDGRLRLERPSPDGGQGQGDGRYQADVGQWRLLVGGLEQRAEGVVVGDEYRPRASTPPGPGCESSARHRSNVVATPSLRAFATVRSVCGPGRDRTGPRSWRHSRTSDALTQRPLHGLVASSEPPVDVVGGPGIAGIVEDLGRSVRPRRCGRAPPPRPRGRAHSCRRPAEPAACCG